MKIIFFALIIIIALTIVCYLGYRMKSARRFGESHPEAAKVIIRRIDSSGWINLLRVNGKKPVWNMEAAVQYYYLLPGVNQVRARYFETTDNRTEYSGAGHSTVNEDIQDIELEIERGREYVLSYDMSTKKFILIPQ